MSAGDTPISSKLVGSDGRHHPRGSNPRDLAPELVPLRSPYPYLPKLSMCQEHLTRTTRWSAFTDPSHGRCAFKALGNVGYQYAVGAKLMMLQGLE